MQSFLTALIGCSVAMSVLILLFIAVTPLMEKRYAAKWRYYAWLVIVIGLIIPLRPHLDTAFIQVDTPASPLMITQSLPIDAANTNTAKGGSNVPWYQLAGCLWLAGAITVIAHHGLKHRRFLRMLNRWGEEITNQQALDTLQKLKDDMGISKQVKIRVCSWITSPMMIGLVNPVILLPTTDFSADELSFVLKHELVHFKRKDLWYKSLVLSATAIHWFNPVVYLMARAIAVQCEISCDAEVVQSTDMDGRQQYSQTIIGVIKNQSRMQTAFSTNFYGGKRDINNRIFSIMDTTKKKAGVFILCFVLIGTMATGVVFAASNKAIDEQKAYSTSTPVSAQEQAKLNQQRKEETAKRYSIYAKYGLTYDQAKDSFYYDGKLVRFFSDKLDANGTYHSFTRADGVVDLQAVRNTKNELTGISPVSQEEYDRRTASMKRAQTSHTQSIAQENASVGNISGSTSAVEAGGIDNTVNGAAGAAFSEGDPNYTDHSLNAYLNYGISYDKANSQWVFNNKPIHFLSDGENATFLDNSANATKNGVSLKVARKADGKIDKLVEITAEEANAFFN